MAQRAYLYTTDKLPDGTGTGLAGRAEVRGDIPISLLLVMGVDPRPVRSVYKGRKAIAARGEGVARLRALYRRAGLSEDDLSAWDLHWKTHPPRRWLVLESSEVDPRPASALCAEIKELVATVDTADFDSLWRRSAADELAATRWRTALFMTFDDPKADPTPAQREAPPPDAPLTRSPLLASLYHRWWTIDEAHKEQLRPLLLDAPSGDAAEERRSASLLAWLCHAWLPAWVSIDPACEALASTLAEARGAAWEEAVTVLEAIAAEARDRVEATYGARRRQWVAGATGRALSRMDDEAFTGWRQDPPARVHAMTAVGDIVYQVLHPWLTARGVAVLMPVARAHLALSSLQRAQACAAAMAVDPAPLKGVQAAVDAVFRPTADALTASLFAWIVAAASDATSGPSSVEPYVPVNPR